MKDLIIHRFEESASLKKTFALDNADRIQRAVLRIAEALKNGGKVMIFGNGGSAADAQHMAAEFVNRFRMDRAPLPALALTTDSSILTSIANDADFSRVFSKQIQALGRKDDVVIAISTSGNSPNVLRGIEQARRAGIYSIALTGGDGGTVKTIADITFCVSATQDTPRIQEIHLTLEHVICEMVEQVLFGHDSL